MKISASLRVCKGICPQGIRPVYIRVYVYVYVCVAIATIAAAIASFSTRLCHSCQDGSSE